MTTVDKAREALLTDARDRLVRLIHSRKGHDAMLAFEAAIRAESTDNFDEISRRLAIAEAKLAALRGAGDAMADAWMGERRRNHWQSTPIPVEEWRALAATPAEDMMGGQAARRMYQDFAVATPAESAVRTCVECGEPWPCDATVRRRKDGIPHRMADR